jgi:hypothetical protein
MFDLFASMSTMDSLDINLEFYIRLMTMLIDWSNVLQTLDDLASQLGFDLKAPKWTPVK